jgi:hypothetical protein
MSDGPSIPEPKNWGEVDQEPFETYYERWPAEYAHVPALVVETWIHRHWRDFQMWRHMRPLSWIYELRRMTSDDVMNIRHVDTWPETLRYWGDDLMTGRSRQKTWLGGAMLASGTTPMPIIVAQDAGKYSHPRGHKPPFQEPYQLIEGHMRLAYLQAMIRHAHTKLQSHHHVFVARLPDDLTS